MSVKSFIMNIIPLHYFQQYNRTFPECSKYTIVKQQVQWRNTASVQQVHNMFKKILVLK